MARGLWEKIHTVNDYYDAPISGVAEVFSLIMNTWSIWLRWRAAFDQGKTTLKTHPVLPEDQERYQELKQAIGDREKLHPDHTRVVDGHFRRIGPGHHAFEVEWLTN